MAGNDSNDQKWSKMIQNDQKWCKMMQDDSKWSQIIQNSLKWFRGSVFLCQKFVYITCCVTL